jgi:hypothetical protein
MSYKFDERTKALLTKLSKRYGLTKTKTIAMGLEALELDGAICNHSKKRMAASWIDLEPVKPVENTNAISHLLGVLASAIRMLIELLAVRLGQYCGSAMI